MSTDDKKNNNNPLENPPADLDTKSLEEREEIRKKIIDRFDSGSKTSLSKSEEEVLFYLAYKSGP